MKKQGKRCFTLLLVCIALFLAAGCTRSNWELSDGTLTIRNDAGMSEWRKYLNAMPEEDWDSITNTIRVAKLGKGVRIIQCSTFQNCQNLETVYMSDSVHTIDRWAFAECTSLKEIHWSKNLQIIEQGAFLGCGFETVKLPDMVQRVRENAFCDCPSLTRVILPSHVTDVSGVSDIYQLKELVFTGTPPYFETGEPIGSTFSDYIGKNQLTVYYLKAYEQYWAPNGETSWNGLPLVGIDSLDDLPPLD